MPTRLLTPERISLARKRRGLNVPDLARALGTVPATIKRYEATAAGADPTALATALNFPLSFFTRPAPPPLDAAGVTFRAARRAAARHRDAAIAAGALAAEIDQWISTRFNLPSTTIPDFNGLDPARAARELRAAWNLGAKPLPNTVQLAEAHGIRVYTLPAIAEAVEAYSLWHEATPYLFLSRSKTPERTRFDTAHEIGHLVLHRTGCRDDARAEREADQFATELLMPRATVTRYLRAHCTAAEVLTARTAFRVSPLTLIHAAHETGRIDDWTYRQLYIDLCMRDGSHEPGSMAAHEMSRVFPQVLTPGRVTTREIADALALPAEEVRALTFGAELHAASPTADVPRTPARSHPQRLRLV